MFFFIFQEIYHLFFIFYTYKKSNLKMISYYIKNERPERPKK